MKKSFSTPVRVGRKMCFLMSNSFNNKIIQGAVVTLTMSRSACYGYDQRCEIFGTEGLASVGNEHTNSAVIAGSSGFLQSRLKHSFPERFDVAFGAELETFANAIMDSEAWPITREDCIATQKVADAGRRSSETNEVVFI